jgi:hypothetical protein
VSPAGRWDTFTVRWYDLDRYVKRLPGRPHPTARGLVCVKVVVVGVAMPHNPTPPSIPSPSPVRW